MNILIVENEKPAAEKISSLLRKLDKSYSIAGITETVEATINRLQKKPPPDLILMDIQLDDGLCFEIFETINVDTPVIFTTAYDEYTLKAFKVNSVDYLLKPIEEDALKIALAKFKRHFGEKLPSGSDFRNILDEFRNQYKSRFLIKIGEKFRSVPVNDASHLYISERSVFLKDFQGKNYGIDYSLEQVQNLLDPGKFFRINRDCIVNIESITMMHSFSSSRLQLVLKNEEKSEIFVVSRDKVAVFKKWVDR